MSRMGLVDFWYYVNEEFSFKDGHMLLRGSNGSGKSVTMQSFIPLLLDGNKSSERLDSFGTRSRKIDNYLIEEDGDRDDRIGYLWLELKRADSDIYKTIGMGLHARKNKQTDSWYFILEDNRRINIDLSLMDKNLALSKQMLKNLVGDKQIIDKQSDYMERVNNALFGFPSIDDYKEAINLLIQLRSPKLSNSLKPSIINDILSNSLQPLSEADLRPMSEAIANMDELKDQLDALKQSENAASTIAKVYDQYNHATLDAKAVVVMEEEAISKLLQKELLQQTKTLEETQTSLTNSKEEKAELLLRQQLLEEEKSGLMQTDVMQLAEDLANCKNDLVKKQRDLQAKEQQEETKDNQRIDAKTQYTKQKDKQEVIFTSMKACMEELDELQEDIDFEEHETLRQEFQQHLERPYDPSFTYQRIKEELATLQDGLNKFQQYNQCKQQAQFTLNTLEQDRSLFDETNRQKEDYEHLYEELLEEYNEKFYHWNDANQELTLNQSQMMELLDLLQQFLVEDRYGDIDAMIHQQYFQRYQSLSEQKSKESVTLKQHQDALLAYTKEQEIWKAKSDPTPQLDEFALQSRICLKEHGIPYRAFYQLLDFDKSLSANQRNTFEELLLRTNLLNALVVEQQYETQIYELTKGLADHYIFVDAPLASLQLQMITEEMIEQKDLTSLFQALAIPTTSLHFYETHYDLGIISGTISTKMESRFIGEASRIRYRKQKIEELQACMDQESIAITNCTNVIASYEQRLQCLEEEVHRYPGKQDLELAKRNILEQERELERIANRVKEAETRYHQLQEQLRLQRYEIEQLANQLGIVSSEEMFLKRKEQFQAYHELLQNLMRQHHTYVSTFELCEVYRETMEHLIFDVDQIRAERKDLELQCKKLQDLIQQKDDLLHQFGYADIQSRVEALLSELKALPHTLSNLDQYIGKLITDQQSTEEQIQHTQLQIEKQKEKVQNAYLVYEKEAQLGYVCTKEELPHYGKVHATIKSKYPQLKRKDALANELQTHFYANRGVLQEYQPSLVSLFEEAEHSVRLDINARYHGGRITFHELLVQLREDIQKQSILIEDSDRSLIEDILVNTISKKIRVHIQNSRYWVEVMNQYMNAMNTSSGLKLSLQWKSHKAETQEELSSEQLVELLEKDVKILKESDLHRLSAHFRSKITSARKISEQEDTHASFHQVMKQVMDYRTWFEFKIFYQKTGEKKKELTNNAFFAFSGGEKAMTMYIPLFSAVAAKFKGAREDAPLLITLDEAFAGVDEKNINNMFALIGKFQFDYIMNSQVLWGDYPSVPALAIHELFRPENARFITVISYEWNGKIKRMVNRP